MKCMVMKRMSVLVSAAVTAFMLMPVFPVDALAQGFVTGSANTDGFSIVGWMRDIGNRIGRGPSPSSCTATPSTGPRSRWSATTSTLTTL